MKQAIDCLLAELGQGHHRNIDLSLDRLWPLLEKLDNPHQKLPQVLHVAGTNGKGSTTLFLHSLLSQLGKKVFAYTSPHLVAFNERILDENAQPIDNATLYRALKTTQDAAKDLPFTFFEITTIAAMLACVEKQPDIVILECGLGGRLDATNTISNPALTILTKIDYDHQEYLGNTIEKIMQEKIGIVKNGTTMIVGPQHQSNLSFLKEKLMQKRIKSIFIDEDVTIDPHYGTKQWNWKNQKQAYCLPRPSLAGIHQLDNAATAIRAVNQLIDENPDDFFVPALTETHIHQALLQTFLPARLQNLPLIAPFDALQGKGWQVILDGGHNENAANSIARFVRQKQRNSAESPACHVILGMLTTKDVLSFVRPIEVIANSIHTLTIPETDDCYTARQLAEITLADGVHSRPVASLQQAIALISQKKPGMIVICGSLYLAGYIFKTMGIQPYEKANEQ